jgi:hypothetical protein
MNWFDFALKLKGFPIERAKEQLRIIKIELQNKNVYIRIDSD